MHEDNLYPVSTENLLPSEPDEQLKAKDDEKSAVTHDYKKIQEAIEYLDTHIAHFGSVMAIAEADRKDPHRFAVTVDSNAHTVEVLSGVKEWFTALIDEHIGK